MSAARIVIAVGGEGQAGAREEAELAADVEGIRPTRNVEGKIMPVLRPVVLMEGRGGEGQEPAAADGDRYGSRQHPNTRHVCVGDLVDQLEAVGRLVELREEGVADVVVVDVEGVARAVDVVHTRDVVSGRA